MKILYMSWFSSGEGSKIHAKEFTRAMEKLGNRVITKDLSIHKTKNSGTIKFNKSNNKSDKGIKNYLKEIKSLLMVFLRFIRLFIYVLKYKPERIIYRYSIYDISAIIVSKLFNIPVVYEINGSIEYERDIANKFYLKKLVRKTEKYIFQNANLILLVSKELERYFAQKNYHMENAIIVPNGVDIERFNKEVELPEKLKWLKEKWSNNKIIGFSGSLKSWHGAERVIDILPQIISEFPEVRFLIIGDGERRKTIETKIKSLQIEDYVYITGFQDYNLIPTLLDMIDIAVAPYQSVQFFHFSPLKIIEYMAKGKPVIAPALGQCVDLVGNENGILLNENTDEELVNAITNLLRNSELCKKLGTNAKNFIQENYTWEKNAKKIENAMLLKTERKKVRGKKK